MDFVDNKRKTTKKVYNNRYRKAKKKVYNNRYRKTKKKVYNNRLKNVIHLIDLCNEYYRI